MRRQRQVLWIRCLNQWAGQNPHLSFSPWFYCFPFQTQSPLLRRHRLLRISPMASRQLSPRKGILFYQSYRHKEGCFAISWLTCLSVFYACHLDLYGKSFFSHAPAFDSLRLSFKFHWFFYTIRISNFFKYFFYISKYFTFFIPWVVFLWICFHSIT